MIQTTCGFFCANANCSRFEQTNTPGEDTSPTDEAIIGFNKIAANDTTFEMYLKIDQAITKEVNAISMGFQTTYNMLFDAYHDSNGETFCVVYNYWVRVDVETQ